MGFSPTSLVATWASVLGVSSGHYRACSGGQVLEEIDGGTIITRKTHYSFKWGCRPGDDLLWSRAGLLQDSVPKNTVNSPDLTKTNRQTGKMQNLNMSENWKINILRPQPQPLSKP